MKVLILLALGILALCDGYRILVVYPFPARSVNNIGEGIARHLLNAGHEVTFLTCYPKHLNHPKLRELDVGVNNDILANDDHMNISYLLNNPTDVSSDVNYIQDMCVDIAEKSLQNENVRILLDDPKETFDLVISDFLETEIYAGFAALSNCPLVWAYSMGAHWNTMRLIDDPPNPAYATDYVTAVEPPFSFFERFEMLWGQIRWRYAKFFNMQPKEKEVYKKIFSPAFARRGRTLPVFEDIIFNASLVVSNEHIAVGDIPKTPQNWKLVGGLHIEVPPKPLPKDLQEIMDKAQHGVIFFSMGSIWRSELVPKEMTEGLLKLFGGLKQTVIWKYEKALKNLPKNVHTVKWAPQQSILAHPNCKIFISHGGLLSSTEALHFAVPVIGVPISYDQNINIKKAVDRGYAIRVKLSYNLPEDLKTALQDMLNDPKYKQKAQELSAIYHDRPVPPGKELVHWLEHVVRTRGALHLRSPSHKAPFYQKAYLDVIAIFFAPVVLSLIIKSVFGEKKVRKEKKN